MKFPLLGKRMVSQLDPVARSILGEKLIESWRDPGGGHGWWRRHSGVLAFFCGNVIRDENRRLSSSSRGTDVSAEYR